MKPVLLSRALSLSLALASGAAWSQPASLPVKSASAQQPSGERELQEAMRRIAVDPTNSSALIDAGNASLELGDAKSALNFFTRASAVKPNDGRILAGLGSASVRTENPFEALRLFDEAVKLGVSERSIAADRALAFDLLGNFGRAQQDYQMARSGSSSDDLIVRQAISLSLSGRTSEADQMLIPLLDRQVMAAWRARAFILAARGDVRESSKVAAGFLDANALQKMDRYLKLMPELTDAQKAAAIHLGHFPQSYEIGRDSEQVKRIAASIPAAGSDRLIPSGTPLGAKPATTAKKETASEKRKREKEEKKLAEATAKLNARKKDEPVKLASNGKANQAANSTLATQSAKARVEQAQSGNITVVSGQLPPPENARPLVSVAKPEQKSLPEAKPIEVKPTEVKVAAAVPANIPAFAGSSADAPSPTPTPTPTPTPAPQQSDFVGPPAGQANDAGQPAKLASVDAPGADIPAVTTPAPGFVSVPSVTNATSASTAASSFDLGAVVASINIPESEQRRAVAPVDLSKIKPAPAKIAAAETAKADAKAAKSKIAANPARNWVQVATGNASAYAFEFKQLAKKSPDLFAGREGWSSEWGNNDRLLVGPFADAKDAKKWEADFRKAGGNAFVWQSAEGAVVSKVAGATAPKSATPATGKQAVKSSAKAEIKPGTAKPKAKANAVKTGAAKESPAKPGTAKPGTAKPGAAKSAAKPTAKQGTKSKAK